MSFDTTSSQPVVAATAAGGDTDASSATRASSTTTPPNLDYVFDDPAHGEPGRDRMLVHGIWELGLAVALAAATYLLFRADSAAFGGDRLRELMVAASFLGALAAGSALTLRAGVPNLAVGSIAIAAAFHFGHNVDGGLASALLTVVGLCALVGLVQGLVIVVLHVPAWAVSLGVAMLLFAWTSRQSVPIGADGFDATATAYFWFGGFCALSIIASLIGLVPSIRRLFGRFRPVADPAQRRGWVAAVIAVATTVVAAVLAGIGGVLLQSGSGIPSGTTGFELTALGLGAALLGGTSAYGRRGGIFGTVFAVALLAVLGAYSAATDRGWSTMLTAAAAVGVGLVATRLVERFGRPKPKENTDDDDDLDWVPKIHGTSDGRTWSSTTSTTTGGLWASDDAWGITGR